MKLAFLLLNIGIPVLSFSQVDTLLLRILSDGSPEPVIYAKIYDLDTQSLYLSDFCGITTIPSYGRDTIRVMIRSVGFYSSLLKLPIADTTTTILYSQVSESFQVWIANKALHDKIEQRCDSLEAILNKK